jgi:uncharacterized membrane protein YphA (DoxX/SURF4 family)
LKKTAEIRHLLTRLSLAVIFLGIGIWEVVQPSYWATYVPSFVAKIANPNLFLLVQGSILIIIGAAILVGLYLKLFSALAAVMMAAILIALITGFGFTDLIIRDLAVLIIAIALYFDDLRYLTLTK